MYRFVIDENLPRSLGPELKALGHEFIDVRDAGLRGERDDLVYKLAQKENAVLISGDLGFADLTEYPVGSHSGMIIVRIPNEVLARERNKIVLKAVKGFKEEPLEGALVVISPSRVRIRRS